MTDAYGNDAATSTGTIADTTNNAASGAPQRAESTERLARPLIKLAKACGLATSFIDQLGTYTEISDAALVRTQGPRRGRIQRRGHRTLHDPT